MPRDEIAPKLSRDEALVLFEWLSEFDERDTSADTPAARKVLWKIEGQLEKVLVEVVNPNYRPLLEEARRRVLQGATQLTPAASQEGAAEELGAREIGEIKHRCEQATPGPWRSFVEARDNIVGSDFIQTAGEDIYLRGATVADQDFIAHARRDIPRLLAEIERLRGLRRSIP